MFLLPPVPRSCLGRLALPGGPSGSATEVLDKGMPFPLCSLVVAHPPFAYTIGFMLCFLSPSTFFTTFKIFFFSKLDDE